MPARGVAVELGVRSGRRGMGRVGGARTVALAISFPISSRCTSRVGDFGLSRWQPDGDMGVETRVIGTFGYLAPEYAQSGQITEKADVYSFGVVLVELVTGRKAVDINRPKGHQLLTEWARPLLEEHAIDDLIDPRLEDRFCENEVYCMLHASNLCIRRDPHSSPRMSHVLRILEGDMVVESGACISAPSSDAGSMSHRMLSDRLHYQEQGSPVQPDPQPRHVGEVNRSPRPSCLSIQAMV